MFNANNNSQSSIRKDGHEFSRREALRSLSSFGILAVTAAWLSEDSNAHPDDKAVLEVGDGAGDEMACKCKCGDQCNDCGNCGTCMCPLAPPGSSEVQVLRAVASSAEVSAGNTNSLTVTTQNGNYGEGKIEKREAGAFAKAQPGSSIGWFAGSNPAISDEEQPV